MRFILKITVPNEPFNSKIKNGSVDKTMQSILTDTKPEAAYFTAVGGKRTAFLVMNIDQASQIPAVAEPWFLQFNAEIEFYPTMLGEDLGKADLATIGSKWGK
jgi:hypothetical protein